MEWDFTARMNSAITMSCFKGCGPMLQFSNGEPFWPFFHSFLVHFALNVNMLLFFSCVFSYFLEWFTIFSQAQKASNSKLFKVLCLMAWGECHVSMIPISLILLSIQLFPKFGLQAPVSWLSSNVFEKVTSFYVNPFFDRFSYLHIS